MEKPRRKKTAKRKMMKIREKKRSLWLKKACKAGNMKIQATETLSGSY